MTAESPSVTTQESPINVYIEPGYMPAWSYTHLFALPYVCDTITCYCLNPVRLHYETLKILGDPGKTDKGIIYVRKLLEQGALRVPMKKSHRVKFEEWGNSRTPPPEFEGGQNEWNESKALCKDISEHRDSKKDLDSVFWDDNYTESSVTEVSRAFDGPSDLRSYFKEQVQNHEDQLPWQGQLRHLGSLPPILADALAGKDDNTRRAYELVYAISTDLQAMNRADSHWPVYPSEKWNEWHNKVRLNVKISGTLLPGTYATTAGPRPTLESVTIRGIAEAIAEIQKSEATANPIQFRQSEAFKSLQRVTRFLLQKASSTEEIREVFGAECRTQKNRFRKLIKEIAELPASREKAKISRLVAPLAIFLLALTAPGVPVRPEDQAVIFGIEVALVASLPVYNKWVRSSATSDVLDGAASQGIWWGYLIDLDQCSEFQELLRVLGV